MFAGIIPDFVSLMFCNFLIEILSECGNEDSFSCAATDGKAILF